MLSTQATIDPEIRRFVEALQADWRAHPPLDSLSFPEARAVAERVRARWAAGGPTMAETVERTVDTTAGPLRVRVHRPEGAAVPSPALIYLHGGGFTLFSLDTHDRLMREYAAQGGFAVIGVDYPLAPETKYPVALDRIEAFVLWLRDHGGALGVDPDRLALGGDSAGGNLSVATCLRLRERGEAGLVKAVLSNYGGFSAELSDESEAKFGGPGAVLDKAEAIQYYRNYLTDMAEASDPFACPMNADLRGLPPIFLVIPECDVITEQSLVMRQRFADAGVETSSKIYPGATHSFLEAMSISALAREAIADGAGFIRSKIG